MQIPLLSILIAIVVIAIIWWAVNYFDLPPMVKKIAVFVVVIVSAIWLIGLMTGSNLVALR